LLSRLALAERVGDRRWTLTLERGPTVHLPADDEADAILRLLAPRQGGRLIDRDVALIDLRTPGRIMLRREPPQAQSAAALRY
jgi:cell division protein FtsQ